MPAYRARLNTAFGSIEIEFDDGKELDERLRQSREFATRIAEQAGVNRALLYRAIKEGRISDNSRAALSPVLMIMLQRPV